MAFTSWILNQTPASGGASLYLIKEMLKSAGWSVQGWGDGSSYANNTSGVDGITSGGSGAGGFNNSNAWVRIQNPDGCELCLQRGSSGEQYVNFDYSASDGFITGGGATTLPTATDGQTVASNYSLFASGGSYYLQGGSDDADGYGFWVAGYNAGGAMTTAFFMDPLVQTDASDTSPGKQDIIHCNSTTAYSKSYLSRRDSPSFGWLKDSWQRIVCMLYTDIDGAGSLSSSFPDGINTNPYSGKDDRVPIIYAKGAYAYSTTFPYGYKGISRFMAWEGTARSTADTKESKTRIVFGSVSVPWDGTTVPNV